MSMLPTKKHLIAALLLILAVIGCNRSKLKWKTGEVEVEPGRFVDVEYLAMGRRGYQGNATFKEVWNGGPEWELFDLRVSNLESNVHWRTYGWPIVLRVHEGNFYGVAFDRCTLTRKKRGVVVRLRYFAQKGDSLREIPAALFPKPIAIQNAMVSADEFFCGNEKTTQLELALKADPNDLCFARELTAYMWAELTTGKSYEELDKSSISTNLLQDYARTNNVIRLTMILKDPQPSTNRRPVTQLEWLLRHL